MVVMSLAENNSPYSNLSHEGYVYAAEVSFFEYEEDKLPNYVVYVNHYDSDEDWPGLEKVINAAIDKAEELGL